MNRLEKYFDTAFAAPDGIKKLREMILTFAMQGKLVPQDPSDQPASELLKEIEAEKQRLVKEKKIKRPKTLPEIKPEEVSYELPQGWKWVRLRDICHDWGQKKPDRHFTYIDVGSIDNKNGVISEAVQLLESSEAPSRARKLVQKGTVIYSTVRPYLQNISIVEKEYQYEPIASTAFAILHPFTGVSNRFIYSYLRSPGFVSYVESTMKGVAYPAINDGDFFKGVFPLPPLAEQHRIVGRIDQLMARCDELEKLRTEHEQKRLEVHTSAIRQLLEAQEQEDFIVAWQFIVCHFGDLYTVKENVAELRKTILQLAVMGKLVPQDPNDPPASELLKEIEAEKRRLVKEKKIKKPKPLPEIKPEEVPYAAPKGWGWVRFGEIASTRLGKMLDKLKNRGNPKPYLRNINVQWDLFELNDIKQMKFTAGELEEFRILPGDLLICEGGEPGRCAIWQKTNVEIYFQKALHRARTFSGVISEYLQICLTNDARNGSLSSYFTGATIKHFPGDKLIRYVLPLPPTIEQHRIVTKVDQLMTLCDTLEQQIDAVTNKQAELLDAVMAKV